MPAASSDSRQTLDSASTRACGRVVTTKRHERGCRWAKALSHIELTADAREVVKAHVDTLVGQLARIIADGVGQREFETTDPVTAARAVFDATARFHNPAHAPEWSDPGIDAAYEGVRALVLSGLTRKRSRRG